MVKNKYLKYILNALIVVGSIIGFIYGSTSNSSDNVSTVISVIIIIFYVFRKRIYNLLGI